MVGAVLRRVPGAPVVVVGGVLLAFGAGHFLADAGPAATTAAEALLVVAPALVVVYGGYDVSTGTFAPIEGLQVFGWTVAFFAFGFVVAGILVLFQLLQGVPVRDVLYLMVTAGSTTAALGMGLARYDHRLRAERAELATQNEQVRTLNKRLTVLQRVLRHNLRNEVSVVLGRVDLLDAGDRDHRERDALRTIERHTRRIAGLRTAPASSTRYGARTSRSSATPPVWSNGSPARSRRPTPGSTSRPTSRSASVVAHPRFEKAVAEALENAVEHTPDGTDIGAAVEASAGDAPVDLRVWDTGPGIPDLELSALDQPGERPLSHATGLGIWLIYWIVEQSGGTLRFESNDPRGTVVRIRVPSA